MNSFFRAACLAVLAPMAAQAQSADGDAEAGEKVFARQCTACHVVMDDEGNLLAGRRGRTGPNLYGVTGNTIGAVEGFAYGTPIQTLNAQGATWTHEAFVGYVLDPTNWLRTKLNDSRARGKMAFKVRSPADAANLFAYLESLSN